ncbi:MAG: GrpB family protein [Candidatus Sumerlaeaceae bacterium]
MNFPAFKQCPVCAEDIRELAKACRYCGAILTTEPLPDFLPAELRRAFAAYEQRMENRDDTDVEERAEVGPIASNMFEQVGVEASLHSRRKLEQFLEGVTEQYRSASVLFVDVTSYTSMCQRRTAEQVKEILDAYYSVCLQAIERYNGFVVKFQGDGCLAVFGAPVAYERDAESAVHAAFEIRQRMRAFPLIHGEKIRVSAGIETGEVLSSVIRSGTRSYDIFGPAVNLAARIQGVAETDTLLIGPATQALVRDSFRFKKHPARHLKNVEQPVVTYEVIGIRGKSAVAHANTSPLLGRAAELAALDSLWNTFEHTTVKGKDTELAGAVLVGDAGIGKSRLMKQFSASKDPIRSFLVETAPFAGRTPWSIWRDLFCHMSGACLTRSRAEISKAFRALLKKCNVAAENTVTMRAIMGDPDCIAKLSALPPGNLRQMIAADIRILLESMANCGGPLIVAFDDLQWADHTSVEVLASILKRPAPRGTFFLVSCRNESSVQTWNFEGLQALVLEELPVSDRESLFGTALDSEELLNLVPADRLKEISGNPFYIIELARSISTVCKAARSHEQRENLMRNALAKVPLSVRELVQSRVDSLESAKKQILQCAAVLGNRFPYRIIELFSFIRDGLLANLYALKNDELLEEAALPDGLEFWFQHNAVREVAYHSLLDRQRRELHRAIAQKIEARFADSLDEHLDTLAYHYGNSDEHESAIKYLRIAGDSAEKLAATHEAIEAYQRLLAHIEKSEYPDRHQQTCMQILRVKGRLHWLAGESPVAQENLDAGMKLACSAGDRKGVACFDIELACVYHSRGEYLKAREYLEHALPEADAEQDPRFCGLLLSRFGMCEWGLGNITEASRYFRQATELNLAGSHPAIAADAWNNYALTEWKTGRLESAAEQFRHAIELYRVAQNKFGIAAAHMNIGIIQENMGLYEQAKESYSEALALAEQIRFRQALTAVHGNLASLGLAMEDFTQANAHSLKSLELAERIGDKRSCAIALENLALSCLLAEDIARAKRILGQARKLAKTLGDAERIFSLDLVEAELKLLQGQVPQAEKKLNSAMSELAIKGYESEKPRLLRLVAMSQLRQGQNQEAYSTAMLCIKVARTQHNTTEEKRVQRVLGSLGLPSHQWSYAEDQIAMVDYDAQWPLDYERDAAIVAGALGQQAAEIHHVGSTAVPGLCSKPLIDILVAVQNLAVVSEYEAYMEAIGFATVPTYDVERHCFRKVPMRTCHVHIVQLHGYHYRRMLAFRDYLRATPLAVKQYAELKTALAREFGSERPLYSRSKTAFIEEAIAAAERDGFMPVPMSALA